MVNIISVILLSQIQILQHNLIDDDNNINNLNICIQDIPDPLKNGKIIKYNILVREEGQEHRYNMSVPSVTPRLTNAVVNVPCSAVVYIAVRAGTKVGISPESNRLYIPPAVKEGGSEVKG